MDPRTKPPEPHRCCAPRISRVALGAACVFAFSLALYGATTFHGYLLDDQNVFTKNRFVQQGFGGIRHILTTDFGAGADERHYLYRPLVLVMFATEKQLFGNSPLVGHGLNVLLYAITCACLFVFLARLLPPLPLSVALLITLLFAAHPTHSEVVANIKSRDEILCFLFLVGLLENLRRFAAGGKARHLAASLALFALALLTKEHAVTFVALVPLVLHFFFRQSGAALAKTTSLFGVVVALYLLARRAVVGVVLMPGDFDGLTNILKLAQTPSEAIGTRLIILWNYLRLLLFPLRLSWDYSYNIVPVTSFLDPRAIAAGLVFLGVALAGLWGLRRRHTFAFGIFFFLVTFSVVSNLIIPIRWTLAERFLFTPSLGMCIAVVAGGKLLLDRVRWTTGTGRVLVVVCFSLALSAFSARTLLRNADWGSELGLALRDVATNPQGARTHYLLGIAYKNRAEATSSADERSRLLRQSLEEFQHSIRIYPQYSRPYVGVAYVHAIMGDFKKAEQASRRALELLPDFPEANNLLASACSSQGRYLEAIAFGEAAIKLKVDFHEAHTNLGIALVQAGRLGEGIAHLKEALRLSPGNPAYRMNLALAQARISPPGGRGAP